MEIRVLRYFLAVAREENISRAAQSLHVTQPTLSKQLMELEDEIGKKLFDRGNRRITLTEDGILLRKRAQEILDLVEKTESELTTDSEEISGDIYIGGGESDAMGLIAKAAKNIHDLYPNIKFHLYSGNSIDVTERLDKGLMDFGIVVEPADIHKYEYLHFPVQDIWGLLMRDDSPLAQKAGVTPEDLIHLPLLCSQQALLYNELSAWTGTEFTDLNIITTYNLIYNAALMVKVGMGYALSLDKLVTESKENHLVFRPLDPELKASLSLIWKKYQVFTPAAQLFLKELQKVFKEYKE